MLQRYKLTPKWLLTLAFIIPVMIMAIYFASRQMAPFGTNSILTVDLGQQYIDFFAYFKQTVLHDPSGFLYSFTKALGGDMLGVFAYYLMSPINWLLLFATTKTLPSFILIMTLVKYGLAGLSMAYLLLKTKTQAGLRVVAFSTAYALCGWMIANQLNLIWLDALVLLPLIVLGIETLITTGKRWPYGLAITAALIINYYMAYMMCIFAVLYFIYALVSHQVHGRNALRKTGNFFGLSLLGGLLSAWLLLPTLAALLQSKAQYTETVIQWKFDVFPPDLAAKFFAGAFNFSQMPKGTANIFVGSLVLIGVIYYFASRTERPAAKWTAAGITAIYILAMTFQPLDLLFHAMQFPIWYPYRFSFIFCFWLVWLAAKALQPTFIPKWWQIGLALLLFLITVTYIALNLKHYSFLSVNQLILGALFFILALGLTAATSVGRNRQIAVLGLLAFVMLESGSNVLLSLNNISYVSNPEFTHYTEKLDQLSNDLVKYDPGFYRTEKTFIRTKNDPAESHYNGGSHFSSTFESATPAFFGKIGQPDGDGFVTYTNGTQVTDALLGMKYFMHEKKVTSNKQTLLPAITRKPDLSNQSTIINDDSATIYRNSNVLSVGYMASSNALRSIANTGNPIDYQTKWFNQLTGNKRPLFAAEAFDHIAYNNVTKQTNLSGAILTRPSLLKPGKVTVTFTPKTNDSYYLTLGSNTSDDGAQIKLNGKKLAQYPIYRNTVTVNVAVHQKNKRMTLSLSFKKPTLWLQSFSLYRLNQTTFDRGMQTLKQHELNITKHNSHRISGTISATKQQPLMATSLPYSAGWHLKVDGHSTKISKTNDIFMAAHLSPGHHHIEFTYWPPLLFPGLIISGITLIFLSGLIIFKRRH